VSSQANLRRIRQMSVLFASVVVVLLTDLLVLAIRALDQKVGKWDLAFVLGALLMVLVLVITALIHERARRRELDKQHLSLANLLNTISNPPKQDHAVRLDNFDSVLEQIAQQMADFRKREQAVVEKVVDVICVISINGKFLAVSPSVSRAWGYTVEEVLDKSVSELIEESHSAKTLESTLGSPQSIDTITIENTLRKKDGTLIHLSWSAHWSAKDGGLFCIAHDISERKQAEQKLQESERRLRTTLECMPVGVVLLHQSGHIEYANRCFKEFTSLSDDELLAIQITELIPVEERNLLRALLQNSKNIPGGNPENSAFVKAEEMHLWRNWRRSSNPRNEDSSKSSDFQIQKLPVEVSSTSFSLQPVSKLLVTFVDITHRKEVERLRSEFVSMVNHDLRTPLNSISGLISLIENGVHGELNQRGKQLCQLALSELNRLLNLVNGLLELDKMRSGKLKVLAQLVSIMDLVEASVSSVRVYAEMREVRLEYDETETSCWADRERIIQVLVNLLSNAIKFSAPDSSVKIKVEQDSKWTKFSVIDHGAGIKDEMKQFLFTRFKQLHTDEDSKSSGSSGLGLSICKAIIEAHQGELVCTDTVPSGCTFSFVLPVCKFDNNDSPFASAE
jgi:PAS domain S-box-containing protein